MVHPSVDHAVEFIRHLLPVLHITSKQRLVLFYYSAVIDARRL